MHLVFHKHQKKENLMIYSRSRIFNEDVEDAYLILPIEIMKKTNVEDIHNQCIRFQNFNLKNINKQKNRKYRKKLG